MSDDPEVEGLGSCQFCQALFVPKRAGEETCSRCKTDVMHVDWELKDQIQDPLESISEILDAADDES